MVWRFQWQEERLEGDEIETFVNVWACGLGVKKKRKRQRETVTESVREVNKKNRVDIFSYLMSKNKNCQWFFRVKHKEYAPCYERDCWSHFFG